MIQYIDKAAVVAEIERRMADYLKESQKSKRPQFFLLGKISGLENLLPFLNTLEVKEVDLEKEFNKILDNIEGMPRMWHSDEQLEWSKNIAKHFFELGLKVRKDLELTWEDIKNLESLCIQKRVNDGLFDKGDYEEVLKRFKAQKEE